MGKIKDLIIEMKNTEGNPQLQNNMLNDYEMLKPEDFVAIYSQYCQPT